MLKQQQRNLKKQVATAISSGVLVKKLPAELLRINSRPAQSLNSNNTSLITLELSSSVREANGIAELFSSFLIAVREKRGSAPNR